MSLIVPDTYELEVLHGVIDAGLTVKLYSNDYTPSGSTTLSAFTECTGGGYAPLILNPANWNVVAGDPTVATYNTTLIWTFTGALGGPGTAYGYYVIKTSNSDLMWAERFPAGSLPFSPSTGSQVRLLARYSVQSQF